MIEKDDKRRVIGGASVEPNARPKEKEKASEAAGKPKPALLEKQAELKEEIKKERKKLKKQRKKLKEERKKREKSSLGTSRGIETMFRTSYRQHVDLSGLADNKSNIMISINGIIISIILASISPKIDSNPFLLIPTSVLLISCLISLVYAILSARPRVSSKTVKLEDVRQNRANILFFGNFVNMNEAEYLEGMTELLQNTDNLYQNMMRDIYSLGGVLALKFRLLRISYTVFMFGLVLGVLLYIGVFIGVVITAPDVAAATSSFPAPADSNLLP